MFRSLQRLILGAAILSSACVAGHAQDPSVPPDNIEVKKKTVRKIEHRRSAEDGSGRPRDHPQDSRFRG